MGEKVNDNDLKIIYLPIDKLIPYKNNPRKNNNAVKFVKNSIKEFGFKVPIIIDKKNVIVTGHTRYKAAKELNLDTVPCIVASDLTKEQIKAFRLADNKVGEFAIWNIDLLSNELEEILNIDMLDFGFFDETLTDEEIEKLIDEEVERRTKEIHQVIVNLDTEKETKKVEKLLIANGYKCEVKNL